MIDDSSTSKGQPLYILHQHETGKKIPLRNGINEIAVKDLSEQNLPCGNDEIVLKFNIHSKERATFRVYEGFPAQITVKTTTIDEDILLNKSCVKTIHFVEGMTFQVHSSKFKLGKFILESNKHIDGGCLATKNIEMLSETNSTKSVAEESFTKSQCEVLCQGEIHNQSALISLLGQEETQNESSKWDSIIISKSLFSHINLAKLNKIFQDNNYFNENSLNDSSKDRHTFTQRKRTREIEETNTCPSSTVSNICRICLDKINSVAKVPQCGHIFCKKCLENWIKLSNTCPLCKTTCKKILIWNQEKNKYHVKNVAMKKFKVEEENEAWIENTLDSCMKCKLGDNNYLMLVCDKCNYNVCHTYCDGLDRIPDGEWLCEICREEERNGGKSTPGFKKKNKYQAEEFK